MAAVPPPLWLLLGPEHGQKQDFVDDLKARLTQTWGAAPEVHRFYAFETPFSGVLSLLQNGDLFAAHKLVLVGNVDDYKKSDNELIKAYAQHPGEGSTLVLLSDETKIEALTRLVPKDQVKVFWELFENQKKGWVLNHFRSLGLGLSDEAAEFFLEMVDNSTDQIRLEAQKLLAFFEKGTSLGLEDLERYLVHSKEENVFTLFEQIGAADFPRALEVLHTIVAAKETEGIGLLGGLTWQFKNLLAFLQLVQTRTPADEAFSTLKIFSKKAQANLHIAARHYRADDLKNMLILTADTDLRLRQFRAEYHPLLLDLYLYGVIVRRGRPLETPSFGWAEAP